MWMARAGTSCCPVWTEHVHSLVSWRGRPWPWHRRLSDLINVDSFYGRPICNTAGHYIFGLWFLSSSFFFFFLFDSSPNSQQWQIGCLPYFHTWCSLSANLECRSEWNMLHAARWKYRMQKIAKNRHLRTIVQLCRAISSQLRHASTIGKKLLDSNISPTYPYNTVNFGLLAAEIVSLVWGTPANFNGFRVLAALLHGTLVVGSAKLWRWTEGATYIRQGGHHIGHWPTF